MDVASLPITALKGVGPKLADKLTRLHLHSVQDVLFHLPLRYQDRTHITSLGRLKPGMEVVVLGKVELTDVVYKGRRSLVCRLSDDTGFINLRFFHFSAIQQRNLQRGHTILAFGEVRFGPAGLEMVHPEYGVYADEQAAQPESALTPVYPATEGVHQLTLRKLVRQALERYLGAVEEYLPPQVLADLELPSITEALEGVHRPPTPADARALECASHQWHQRLVFEELLAHHLRLMRLRAQQRAHVAPSIAGDGSVLNPLLANLPFALTGAQRKVIHEVRHDLQHAVPMQRLLQGDVGSGKTVVAAAAGACAVEAGYQVAVMAPTEILAEQHVQNFEQWLRPLGVEVVSLLGKHNIKTRRAALDAIRSTRAAVIVGTHTLFQEGVEFANLGLVIVDEQQRFGVHQRLALREKGASGDCQPHQLIMTATPIPRTLAQTVYADLDVSVIDELPPGRKAVETVVVPASRRAEVVQRIRSACLQGRQAYWVCPLIEESDHLQLQTATETEMKLHEALTELRVSLVHGRVKPAEKDAIMAEFRSGKIDLLVATTVIEVGVDVPNASLMIIENAERLGLSQLHQLRGRVGRGANQSSCVLMYQPPLSEHARQRLTVMRRTVDGFEIARKDLEMRGPGELLGTRQTGIEQFRIADLMRDHRLLARVQKAARLLSRDYPEQTDAIIRRWTAPTEDYAQV
ncbi:MAG: ATP-dependent DNA helicase RecG [Acidiferrobacterales bacterium]|nr:ATP-dependent DNA helicase RecG [Gammaproteobacteria bacterium]